MIGWGLTNKDSLTGSLLHTTCTIMPDGIGMLAAQRRNRDKEREVGGFTGGGGEGPGGFEEDQGRRGECRQTEA